MFRYTANIIVAAHANKRHPVTPTSISIIVSLVVNVSSSGETVEKTLGDLDGDIVTGPSVGETKTVGLSVGWLSVGDTVGSSTGEIVGLEIVGLIVGLRVGSVKVGPYVGLPVGLDAVGTIVGETVGAVTVGLTVGEIVGLDTVGPIVGDAVGLDILGPSVSLKLVPAFAT